MRRSFDWLVVGSWAGIITAGVIFWVGVVAIVEWLT